MDKEKLDEALANIQRMQDFKVQSLSRKTQLGERLCFDACIEPAKKVKEFYLQMSLDFLTKFSDNAINKISQQALNDYNIFKEILDFTTSISNPEAVRTSIIAKVEAMHEQTFNALYQYVAYTVSMSVDFKRLEREGRAAVQVIKDETERLQASLKLKEKDAQTILDEIKKTAGEQGVSQQASFFNREATDHKENSEKWLIGTAIMSVVLGVYAFASLFLHKWIIPANTYETIQLGISKTLIFAVISSMLYLCVRNFLAHKHNTIVNKHRQVALQTYTVLADAAQSRDSRDVILAHAASCIFNPQPTGYSKTMDSQAPSAKSVVELLAKPLIGGHE